MEVSQDSGVAAGWIIVAVLHLGVLFAPINPQPLRQPDLVSCLLRSEQMEILIVSDQFLESTSRDDITLNKLMFDRWPYRLRHNEYPPSEMIV